MSRHHVQNMQRVYGNTALLGYTAVTGSMVRSQIDALRSLALLQLLLHAVF